MSKANQTQVAGTHYRNDDQHWDLAAELELGYFEGQITKYITRHRRKKGLEDVQKAQHFLTKLIELAQAGKRPQSTGASVVRISAYAASNGLNDTEEKIIYAVVNWVEPFVLAYTLIQTGILIRSTYPPEEAGAGYVNQDR